MISPHTTPAVVISLCGPRGLVQQGNDQKRQRPSALLGPDEAFEFPTNSSCQTVPSPGISPPRKPHNTHHTEIQRMLLKIEPGAAQKAADYMLIIFLDVIRS